ncbi:putative G-protein coupled receptor 19 [Nelusetta ayraudi]|uniref:putative G-protein coupled receptor 19 n=1 Tax=Nelusetta ayraudi TaxID=303726 RepID=UPI003F710265
MVYAPSAGAVGVVSSLYAPAFRYQAAFNFSERDNSSASPPPPPCAAPGSSASPPNDTGPSPSAAPSPSSASSGHGPASYQLSGGEVWALAAVLAALWLVSVVGNSLVLLVVQRSRRTQSTTNHFVVSLASADLLLSLGVAPFALLQVVWGGWPLGGAACRALRYLQHLCPGVQAFVLLSIAVDRFYTIVFPLSFKVSRDKAKRMIAASWLLDSAFVSPCLFLYGGPAAPVDSAHCRFFLADSWAGLAYASLHLLVGCVAPAALVVFFYQRVVRHIWRLGADGHALRRTTNVVPRTKVKTVKMFLVLNSLFFLTWTPFYVAQLWHPGEAEGPSRQGVLLFAAVAWLSLGSAASKPTLYSVYNANFRRGMRETFCMSSMKCYRSNAYTITASSRMAKKNHVGVVDVSTQAKAAAAKDSAVYSAFDHEAKEKKLAWPTNSNPSNTFV